LISHSDTIAMTMRDISGTTPAAASGGIHGAVVLLDTQANTHVCKINRNENSPELTD
jgi:hypothetical protein